MFTVIQTEQVQDVTCSNAGISDQNNNCYRLCLGLSDCIEGQTSEDLIAGIAT